MASGPSQRPEPKGEICAQPGSLVNTIIPLSKNRGEKTSTETETETEDATSKLKIWKKERANEI